VLEGKFLPGARLHGWGTRRSPDGNTLVGEFREGDPFGDMLLVKPDGAQEVVSYAWGGKPPLPAATQKAGTGTAAPPPDSGQKPQEPPPSSATKPVEDVTNTIRTLRGIFGK
jgi:hypothetical protein